MQIQYQYLGEEATDYILVLWIQLLISWYTYSAIHNKSVAIASDRIQKQNKYDPESHGVWVVAIGYDCTIGTIGAAKEK